MFLERLTAKPGTYHSRIFCGLYHRVALVHCHSLKTLKAILYIGRPQRCSTHTCTQWYLNLSPKTVNGTFWINVWNQSSETKCLFLWLYALFEIIQWLYGDFQWRWLMMHPEASTLPQHQQNIMQEPASLCGGTWKAKYKFLRVGGNSMYKSPRKNQSWGRTRSQIQLIYCHDKSVTNRNEHMLQFQSIKVCNLGLQQGYLGRAQSHCRRATKLLPDNIYKMLFVFFIKCFWYSIQ